jgi:hypothetical protein
MPTTLGRTLLISGGSVGGAAISAMSTGSREGAAGRRSGANSRHCGRNFFISIMNRAMSWASFRLSGGFGIVACGRNRNETIMSASIASLAAIEANDGIPRNLSVADPIAWHSEHHRFDNRLPFSAFCANVAWTPPNRTSATERCNLRICMAAVSWVLRAVRHPPSTAPAAMKRNRRHQGLLREADSCRAHHELV